MSTLQIVAIVIGSVFAMVFVVVALGLAAMGKQSAERADAMEAEARRQEAAADDERAA